MMMVVYSSIATVISRRARQSHFYLSYQSQVGNAFVIPMLSEVTHVNVVAAVPYLLPLEVGEKTDNSK